MNFQDWNTVTWDKRGEKQDGQSNKKFLNEQARKGNVVSQVKNTNSNKNTNKVDINVRKIELASEEGNLKHVTLGSEIGKRIAQARCEKKLTQKELANALYIQESVIKEFESGKALYNPNILNKLEKYLGKKLRN